MSARDEVKKSPSSLESAVKIAALEEQVKAVIHRVSILESAAVRQQEARQALYTRLRVLEKSMSRVPTTTEKHTLRDIVAAYRDRKLFWKKTKEKMIVRGTVGIVTLVGIGLWDYIVGIIKLIKESVK